MPAWHQLVPISGHVEESETARKLQLYATSIKTSVSTRLKQGETRTSHEPIPHPLRGHNLVHFAHML